MTPPTCLVSLSVNLMANVLRGEIKSIFRRTKAAKTLIRQQQKSGMTDRTDTVYLFDDEGDTVIGTKDVRYRPSRPDLNHFVDPKSPYKLVIKSKAKLKRKGKPCSFY